MKIVVDNIGQWAVLEDEKNVILNVQENSIIESDSILLAKTVTEENLAEYFREISPEEAGKLKEQEEENACGMK